MKRIISILLFFILVAILILLFLWQKNVQTASLQKIQTKCSSIDSRHFSSELSHALIVRGGALASVRLAGEKNFSPPGGHIETGEDPRGSLVRETKEELGLSVDRNNLSLYKIHCDVIGTSRTQRTYIYSLPSWSGIMNPPKSSQLKWVTSEFRLDPSADTELIKMLDFAKKDGMIQ